MTSVSDIELFVRIVDHGTLAGAAQTLGLSRATASRRLKRLETRLFTKLLHISPRRLALTDAGRLYYDRVRRLAEEIARTEALVAQFDGTPRGRFRIGCPDIFRTTLSDLVAGFVEAHPHVIGEVVLCAGDADLLDEGFSAAIRMAPPCDLPWPAHHLWSFRYGAWTSPGFEGEVSLDGPTIGTRWPHVNGAWIQPGSRLELPLRDTLAAVRAGRGIAVLPDFLASGLVPVLPEIGGPGAVDLLLRARSSEDAMTRAFVSHAVPALRGCASACG